MVFVEIERKFLLDKFPDIECVRAAEILQGYISINPEVRIRSYRFGEHADFKLTVKSDGDLSREEVETYISEDTFDKLSKIIGKPLITKLYKKYKLDNGLILQCSLVDEGFTSAFMYAEIEFDNEQQAMDFVTPFYLGKDVTFDPSYKMKNYWDKTRGISYV